MNSFSRQWVRILTNLLETDKVYETLTKTLDGRSQREEVGRCDFVTQRHQTGNL